MLHLSCAPSSVLKLPPFVQARAETIFDQGALPPKGPPSACCEESGVAGRQEGPTAIANPQALSQRRSNLKKLCLQNLEDHAPPQVRHVVLRESESAAASDEVGVGAHEDAAIEAVTLGWHALFVPQVYPLALVESRFLFHALISELVYEILAQVLKHAVVRAEEGVDVLEALLHEIYDRKGPVIATDVDWDDDQVFVEEVDLPGPSLHILVSVAARAASQLGIELRAKEVDLEMRTRRVRGVSLSPRLEHLEEVVDHLVVEPLLGAQGPHILARHRDVHVVGERLVLVAICEAGVHALLRFGRERGELYRSAG
mmetsp:Transcript_33192/g.70915  ORF Transcript_33192/g.70915 Transcript_33192/m.70915 type:complete len:314 (+) Transcript_33192:180-1121(+)